MTQLRRERTDRRVLYGKWSRYQIRKNAIQTAFSYFDDDWVLLRHNVLRFPEKCFQSTARHRQYRVSSRAARPLSDTQVSKKRSRIRTSKHMSTPPSCINAHSRR